MSFNKDKMQQIGIKEMYMPIDDYSNYEVSNYGNIKNKKTGKILKPALNNKGYEYVNLYDGTNKPKTFKIHRLVLITFEGKSKDENQKCVDHIDNDRTNNCLFNLRWVSQQQNNFNRLMNKNNTSGIKGVRFDKARNKWKAYIMINGKLNHLGYFENIEDAKIARQNKAIELFGNYLNKCEM
jgi:hypothetical protein